MSEHPTEPWLLRFAGTHPFLMAMAGAVLMLLSFPPVGWWPLAWFAPLPYLALIATERFHARRPWLHIWVACVFYWAAEAYYISIPHPALWVAWISLFLYLSVYPLLFVWIGRKLVHGQRLSILFAAPVVFTALEWVRAHGLSGFGFSMLANSQYQQPWLIQVCDIAGAYGLTFLMVAFATGVFVLVTQRRISGLAYALLIVSLVAGYGSIRLNQIDELDGKTLDVVVVQGNIDTQFPDSQQALREYQRQRFLEYYQLQSQWHAESGWRVPDLIIWPEGKYPIPHTLPGGGAVEEETRLEFQKYHDMVYAGFRANALSGSMPPTMIVGTGTHDPVQDEYYNSAVLIDPSGKVQGMYHKMHLVPFGEFIPFSSWFPVLNEMTPIGSGYLTGPRPTRFQVEGWNIAPSVCFESAVAHRIHESIGYLTSLGEAPDLLVNVTDDGWFFGHAVLDHHLACNVMRTVENRKPGIVAANTGLSAFIQLDGKILLAGPRRESRILEMAFPVKQTRSLYASVGDWPAIFMTILCVLAVLVPAKQKRGSSSP